MINPNKYIWIKGKKYYYVRTILNLKEIISKLKQLKESGVRFKYYFHIINTLSLLYAKGIKPDYLNTLLNKI